MKKYIILLLIIFSINHTQAQVAWNMELLSMYDDNTIPDNGDNQKAYNEIWGYAKDGREYAIVGSAAYIHFFDVTIPTIPFLLEEFAGGDTTVWRDIKTYENYAYTVSDDTEEGMMIFDLSGLPFSISLVSQTNAFFDKAHNIFIDEENGRLYVAGSNTLSNGLIVLDIGSNPTNPDLIGNDTLLDYSHDVYVRDNIAYCSHGDIATFAVYDYTDAAQPKLKGAVTTNGYNHSSWLSEDGSYAVFAEEVPPGLPLGIADLTNIENEVIEVETYFQFPLITTDDHFNTAHNPFILGNYAIVSYYEDGVQIIDLTDPSNPVLAGYYDTFPNNTNYQGYFGCWGVYPFLPSGNIIASDRKYGLHVLRFNGSLTSVEDDFSEKDIAIFPNPSLNGKFNILNNKIEGKQTLLEVIDVSGKLVHQQILTNTSEQVNLSALPNGFYFGKIKIGEQEVVKKLVISK